MPAETTMNTSEPDCDTILEILAASAPPPMSPTAVDLYIACMIIFSLITLSGNGLVIYSIATFDFLRKRHNAHVASLAFADMCLAFIVMPLEIYAAWNASWDLPQWMCYVGNVFIMCLVQISIANLFVLAWERYIAICHPFKYHKLSSTSTACTVIMTWLLPGAFTATLYGSGWVLEGQEDIFLCLLNIGVCAYLQNPSIMYLSMAVITYIPMIFISYLYARIYAAAKKQALQIRSVNMSDEDRKKNMQLKGNTKAARTLSLIVGVFFLCWVPVNVVVLIDNLTDYTIVPPLLIQVCAWLGYLNSMMNPFLYYLLSPDFKTAFKRLLRCKTANVGFTTNFEDI